MYSEDELLQLSSLNQFLYCDRRCALIHIEQTWEENFFTAMGKVMHEKVDIPTTESRRDLKIEYGMPLRSLRLGLVGKADAVEFHKQPDGSWLPFPVEHKLGKPKIDDSDRVQLCAQAMCIEEMRNVQILTGALFYGRPRRREEVTFDEPLRQKTRETAGKVHTLIKGGVTPPAVYEKKCDACSLFNICLPKLGSRGRSAAHYVDQLLAEP